MKKRFRKTALCLALLMGGSLWASCGGGGEVDEFVKDDGAFYTITALMPFNDLAIPPDLSSVVKEVNVILREKINAELEIVPYLLSEFPTKSSNYLNSGDSYDMVWTNSASYYTFLEQEYFYPIGELIKRDAPQLYAQFDEKIWDQFRYRGKIYAAPNLQILPRTAVMVVRDENLYADFMTEKSLTEESVALLPLEDRLSVMESYFYWLRTNNKGKKGLTYGMNLTQFLTTYARFDDLGQGYGVPGVVRVSENGTPEIIDQFTSPEFLLYMDTLKRWYNKGYIPADSGQHVYEQADLDAWIGDTWKPDDRTEYKVGGQSRYMRSIQMGQPAYLQSYLLGTMWSVSRHSGNPARVVKFLELLHTDAELHNLLKLGIEGEHYVTFDDTDGGVKAEFISSRYQNDTTRWALGNEFLGIPLKGQSKDAFVKAKEINDSTPMSSVLGFVFDRDPVYDEILACTAVYTAYEQRFSNARELVTVETLYEDFLRDMESAGSARLLAEKRAQLSAWLESR